MVSLHLCRPQLAEGTYRDIARAAGVALGAVGPECGISKLAAFWYNERTEH
jgi:hypothetical protein